ncbi:MAG: hypothetical protein OES46_05300 [Gammaproteobacteria bacterium]|nr:hypothetical protein [Gammaproteobacteria bacterium]
MSAPRAEWIPMHVAETMIRKETQVLPETYEPAFLKALADGAIHVRHTIQYETDIRGGIQRDQKPLDPEFWTREMELERGFWAPPPTHRWAMREPNENVRWHFEVHYEELLAWLSQTTKAKTGKPKGRPPVKPWDAFWIEAVLLANTPDGLPDIQADFLRHMARWSEDKFGESTIQDFGESTIKEKASKLYEAKKARK